MEELFLHFIWKYRRYNQRELLTTQGQQLEVIDPGQDHTAAGPDFRMAHIKLGNLEWVGPIEIHVNSSDWFAHGHQNDTNYDPVLLHVVWKDDRPVTNNNGERIPTLELCGRVHRKVFDRWKELRADMYWIPCEPFLGDFDELFWKAHWERMMVTRLEERSQEWKLRLLNNQHHWEETFYQVLCRSFGLKENSEPFEQVALRTPLRIIRREAHEYRSILALLIGQSGWCSKGSVRKDYVDLFAHYHVLRLKHHLEPIDARLWKFGGIRPPNHPNKRMEQLARLLYSYPDLVHRLLKMNDPNEWISLCNRAIGKGFGLAKSRVVLLNAIVPLLFYYGRWRGDQSFIEKALNWAQSLSAENNRIVQSFVARGIPVESALDGQAAQHQFVHYCRPKKCLICQVGKRVLNR
ncbi:MAG: DUF2851 family protein [Flavobacteriales bacterium]|nr:DUF2851 family protein [Flavobacteriales bacterium]